MDSLPKNPLISFLRWSERYTKTDMVYLASGGIWLAIAQTSASLAGFGLTVAFANLLPQESLGEYRYLMSGVLILTIFALPGIRSALTESTPKGFRGNLAVAFASMRRWSMLGSLAAVSIAFYYLWNGNQGLALGFGVMAAAIPWLDSSAVYLEYLKALKEFRRVALYTLVTRFIGFVAIIIVAFLYPNHAWIILAAFLAGSILPNLFFHARTERVFTRPGDPIDPGLLRYARHLSIMAALSLLSMQLDKVFVWYFLGADELALFFIAYAIPQEAARFLAIVPALAFPKFSVAASGTVRQTLLPKIFLYAALIGILVIAYIVVAPFIFGLFFPQYLEAVPYSQALMIAAVASAFLPISTYFTAQKRTRILYFIAMFVPTIRIAATVAFIALYGLWGAVYALLLEATASTACYLYFFTRDRVQP